MCVCALVQQRARIDISNNQGQPRGEAVIRAPRRPPPGRHVALSG